MKITNQLKPEVEPIAVETENKDKKKEKWSYLLLLLVVVPISIYFYFGLKHLTEFETADEHLWISDLRTGRIQQYWNAIEQKDWARTRINDKPGVTLALISGINMKKEGNVEDKIIDKSPTWTIYNPQKAIESYQLYRLPIVIANGVMGLFFFLAIWRLTKKHWLALSGASLVMLSPILIGISQIINPDAFLWVFSFATILSFALFLQKNKWWVNIIDLLLTIIFLGLAILSKYVALVLFPFLLVMLLWYILENYQSLMEKEIFRKKMIFITLGLPLAIAGAIGVFALLMPAAIIKPEIITKSILNFGGMRDILMICGIVDAFILLDAVIIKSFLIRFLCKHLGILKEILPRILYVTMIVLFATTLINWSLKGNALHGLSFIDSAKGSPLLQLPFYLQMISESQPVVFALTPVVLVLMFFAWAKSLYKRSEFDYLLFIASAFFLVFFYAIIKQSLLLQVRYSLVVFPLAGLIAAIGLHELTKKLKHRYAVIFFFLLIGASFYSVNDIKPYYFAYTNQFLPKNYLISDSWGYGGYEALEYIRSQGGDLKKMKIWTDYYGACQFFPGKCVSEGQVKWAKDAEVMNIDYVISTHDGKNKNKAGLARINKIFPTDEPVWELNIDGRPDNFVRVYKNNLKVTTN